MWEDRHRAGVLLAGRLSSYTNRQGTLVIGLARGGVVVASVIASELHLPLLVLVVKKIPSPGSPELAIGAVAPNGVTIVDRDRAGIVGADETYIRDGIKRLEEVVKEKMTAYYKNKPIPSVRGKQVLLVDDGVATGATMEAAIAWCRKMRSGAIIVAAPVIADDTVSRLKKNVSDIVPLEVAYDMGAVGEYYRNFEQVEDRDVIQLIQTNA